MKLAEALLLRADRKKRLDQLKARLIASAKFQEGETPAEDPVELLADMERTAAELERMIRLINRTNAATPFPTATRADGTLSDALARRDVLALRRAVYAELATAATVTQTRYSKSEVKFRSSVPVAEMQKLADGIAKEYRELDARVQEINWRSDLLE